MLTRIVLSFMGIERSLESGCLGIYDLSSGFYMDGRVSDAVVCDRATVLAPCSGTGGYGDQKGCFSSCHLPFTLVKCSRPLEGELTSIPHRNQKASHRIHSISYPKSHRKASFGRRQPSTALSVPTTPQPRKGSPGSLPSQAGPTVPPPAPKKLSGGRRHMP